MMKQRNIYVDCVDTPELLMHDYEDQENPIISLHAILGISGYQTMRVEGKIKPLEVVMLVDSGSTHNFLDYNLAKVLKLPYKRGFRKEVTVANREAICTADYYKGVEWPVQSVRFITNFFILPLHGCDAVLGVQ
ncbi:Aspartic peptidase [Corchorus olitorius]|uniref:Aspartic peptidase n=1 Tax=Corchorus olitorius TaxID=93759 RepID=A0A1R3JDM2_9ROSI|nr:Aspartic peptidase [Corchorus olitorius]